MGVFKRPKMSDYWSTGWYEGPSPCRFLMKRERFFQILRSLQFTDQREIPERGDNKGDKLYKFRDLIDNLNVVYEQNYYPNEGLSIDEALVKYSGNMSGYKVRMPQKAAKQGFKQYRINDAKTSYCIRTETYSKSPADKWKHVQFRNYDLREYTDPAKIVLFLIKPYLGVGHTLGVDSFYSEPRLFRLLLEEKTNCIGALKDKRYMPKMAYGKKLKLMQPADTKHWYSKKIDEERGLLVLAWKDNKEVRIISSFHKHDQYELPADTENRRKRRKNNDILRKPLAVVDYKRVMPGIDRQDQYMSYYTTKRLRLKRVHRLMFTIHLEITLFNSFVVYCELMNKDKKLYTYLDFRRNFFTQTLTKYRPDVGHNVLNRPVPSNPNLPVSDEVRYNWSLGHFAAKRGEAISATGKNIPYTENVPNVLKQLMMIKESQ